VAPQPDGRAILARRALRQPASLAAGTPAVGDARTCTPAAGVTVELHGEPGGTAWLRIVTRDGRLAAAAVGAINDWWMREVREAELQQLPRLRAAPAPAANGVRRFRVTLAGGAGERELLVAAFDTSRRAGWLLQLDRREARLPACGWQAVSEWAVGLGARLAARRVQEQYGHRMPNERFARPRARFGGRRAA